MNTVVQAGPLTVSVVAKLVNPNVSVATSFVVMVINRVDTEATCLDHTLTINGHSISAINPDKFYVGGQAMPIAA